MSKHIRSLCDSDALEVKALAERKLNVISELLEIEEKKINLKRELLELSDSSLAKDYNVKTDVIFGIRNGKTYKHLENEYAILKSKISPARCKVLSSSNEVTSCN